MPALTSSQLRGRSFLICHLFLMSISVAELRPIMILNSMVLHVRLESGVI